MSTAIISNKSQKLNFKAILPLAMLHLTIYLAAASVAYKLVQVGPLLEPGPPFIFPLTYAIGAIIAEVYGFKLSKYIIYYTLGFEILFGCLITIVINLSSPANWANQAAYVTVFGHILRFILSGFFAVFFSSIFNVYLFSKLKVLMKGKKFWVRILVSSLSGSFILVFIIVAFGYSAVLSLHELVKLFCSIYILEVIYSLILIWPSWKFSGLLKLIEKTDTFDYNLSITDMFKL